MDEKEQRRIFTRNFRYYIDSCGKSQKEVAKELGYSYTTMNTWYRGSSMPSAAKIQTLSDYFGIEKSDLLDDKSANPSEYYTNPESARIGQEILEDPDLHALFDAARDVTPEALRQAVEILKLFKKQRGE